MTYSKIFLYFCVSFIAGIFIKSFFNFNIPAMLVVLILAILLISVFYKRKTAVVIGFCLFFLLLGIFHLHRHELSIANNPLTLMAGQNQENVFFGTVCAEPDVRKTTTKLSICEIESLDNSENFLDGKILITVKKYPEYKYGDNIKIIGTLEEPVVFDSFDYKKYLAKDGICAVMYFPKIKLLDKTNVSKTFLNTLVENSFGAILDFKKKLKRVISQNLSPPQSSILGSIILGDKRKISDQWKEKLNITGTRHITCISGMHIIILSGMLMRLGIALGLWRRTAFYFTVFLLFLFIIMVGAPPSAMRAGIMAGMILFAQKIGRLRSADRAIVFAAVLILFFNPFLLSRDIGFQLSFLASIGIIYLHPIAQNFYPGKMIKQYFQLSQDSIRSIWDIVFMSLSAQIFTLPILIYNFGYVSLVVIFTNILIIPILPLIFGLGFVFILLGAVCGFLGWLLSLPCWLLLTYIIIVVEKFSLLSYASYNLTVPWMFIPVFYIILGIIVWHYNKKFSLPRFLR
jgi:competence protein ComEC